MITKAELTNLAIFGGPPAFKSPLHVGRPNTPGRERLLNRINTILETGWLTNNGPCVEELERRLAEYLGVKHCLVMCNGTIALEISIRALGLKGEVIIPSFTFVATAHALQWQEITPVFCDVAPGTHHIDPDRIEQLITPRTTGIIGVHVWGQPCDVASLADLADRHHLRVLYDAAHAFGCSHQNRMIGGFGDAEIFSFHATKFFNTFEGGAVATNDDELARRMRFMRNFGFAGYDDVQYIGINGKMSEVSAAMGLTQLEELETIIATNHRNCTHYAALLDPVPGLRRIRFADNERQNYQYIIVELNPEVTGISRDDMIQVLHAENVLARRYFYPGCHQMEPYRSYFPHAGLLLPNTNLLVQRVMSLPNGIAVTPADIEVIAGLIAFVVEHGPEIARRLHDSPDHRLS